MAKPRRLLTAKHFIIRDVFDSPPQKRRVDSALDFESYPTGNFLRKYSEERETEKHAANSMNWYLVVQVNSRFQASFV